MLFQIRLKFWMFDNKIISLKNEIRWTEYKCRIVNVTLDLQRFMVKIGTDLLFSLKSRL